MKKNKQKSTFWLYGHHAVTAALRNPNREKIEIRLTNESEIDKKVLKNLPVKIVSRQELDSLLPPGAIHQGVALSVKPLEPVYLEDIIRLTQSKERSVLLILDQVTDPHNIGAILRSSAAFNSDAVILPDANAPEETGTLAKSACGALESVPLVRVANLVRAIRELKDAGYWVLGLDGYADQFITDDKLPAKTVFVLGSEGEGMRRLTAEKCDYTIKLPICDKMESLNVSNAAAIALYEFYRSSRA